MDNLNYILSIATGLAVCIPLVVKLIQYVCQVEKDKNWSVLMKMIWVYMEEAERMLKTGAEKKEYVLAAIKQFSACINYDIDMEQVSQMIDGLCALAKQVNAPSK